jgi:hypothetical protein
MANQETQLLDDIIVSSRRKVLSFGAASLAGLMLASTTRSAKAAATYSDNDILNFALNLEYLEANFYYLAAFGCTIDKPNAAAIAAGAPAAGIPISLSGGVGTAGTVTGGSMVPFTTIQVGSYAVETAIEEGKHVLALQGALGTMAVNQPAINLAGGTGGSFGELAQAATITTDQSFSPYAAEADFLIGAYVFVDRFARYSQRRGGDSCRGSISCWTHPNHAQLSRPYRCAWFGRVHDKGVDFAGHSLECGAAWCCDTSSIRCATRRLWYCRYDVHATDRQRQRNPHRRRRSKYRCRVRAQHHPGPEHCYRWRSGKKRSGRQPGYRDIFPEWPQCWCERLQVDSSACRACRPPGGGSFLLHGSNLIVT